MFLLLPRVHHPRNLVCSLYMTILFLFFLKNMDETKGFIAHQHGLYCKKNDNESPIVGVGLQLKPRIAG